MKFKIGYQIDGLGKYIPMPPGEELQIRENPRKAGHYPCAKNIIFEKPPETEAYESAVWNGDKWEIIPDFTGKEFYNKKTSESYVGNIELGDVIDLDEWVEERPDDRYLYQFFNSATSKWEEDLIRKAEAEKQGQLAALKSQMNVIDIKNIRNIVAFFDGTATKEDYDYYDAYKQQIKTLKDEYNRLKEE